MCCLPGLSALNQPLLFVPTLSVFVPTLSVPTESTQPAGFYPESPAAPDRSPPSLLSRPKHEGLAYPATSLTTPEHEATASCHSPVQKAAARYSSIDFSAAVKNECRKEGDKDLLRKCRHCSKTKSDSVWRRTFLLCTFPATARVGVMRFSSAIV